MKFDCFERPLSAFFYRYGKSVALVPSIFIIIPLLFTGVLSLGFLFGVNVAEDSVELYTPTNGRAKGEKKLLVDHFPPLSDSDPLYLERRYDTRRTGFVVVTANKDQLSDDVLNPILMDEINSLWLQIESLLVVDNLTLVNYTYQCVKVSYPPGICAQNPLLFAYRLNPAVIRQLHYPKTDFGLPIAGLLGGIRLGSNSLVVHASAILLPYQLRHQSRLDNHRAGLWESALSQFLQSYKSAKLQLNWITSNTLVEETKSDTKTLTVLLGPLFGVVTIFTLACCFVRSWVRSKPWLGLAGILSAACAILSAMGLLMFTRMRITTVTFFMPYIIFSIGVDNVFILLAAWRKTNRTATVAERMGLAFKEAGVSITVTSLTDVLSFGTGCSSTFPSVRIFCISATLAVVFVYFFQLTLFAGFMVLSGRREAAGLNCFTFRPVHKPIKTSSTSMFRVPSENSILDDNVKDVSLSLFFRDTYSHYLLSTPMKLLVMVMFSTYIGFAVWGCTRLKIGFQPTDLLPRDSQAQKAFLLQDRLFSQYGGQLHILVRNLSNLSTTEHPYWMLIDADIGRFDATAHTDYVDSWLRTFLVFCKASGLLLTDNNFVSVLRGQFLSQPAYQKYLGDVIFTDVGQKLSAARFVVPLKNVTFATQADAQRQLRLLAERSRLQMSVYADFFELADQYDTLLPYTLINVAMAGGAVVLVSLLLIPKPLCSIWVCLTIASINVGILGYMSFWDVQLDIVSMTTIIMSIGFCVDFSAHFAYHFAKETETKAVDKVKSALQSVGTPIVQSAISTILGVLILLMVDSYIYRAFVKTVGLVVILGLFHGLVVLPVLLTLFHCDSQTSSEAKKKRLAAQLPQPQLYGYARNVSLENEAERISTVTHQQQHFYPTAKENFSTDYYGIQPCPVHSDHPSSSGISWPTNRAADKSVSKTQISWEDPQWPSSWQQQHHRWQPGQTTSDNNSTIGLYLL